MITHLHISNYALIDSIDIDFGEGLNIITGETGAGKSIILGALNMLLGARADSKVIKHPDEKSVVEASFDLTSAQIPKIALILEEAEIEMLPESQSITLRRELTSSGRNRVFVNDELTTLGNLQRIASELIDIHSQHQNALLSDPNFQIGLIDSLAKNHKIKKQYSDAYSAYRHALRRYKHERTLLDQAREEEEFLRFQYAQLSETQLVNGEIEQLEAEQAMLQNAEEISGTLQSILNLIDKDETGANNQLEIASSLAAKLNTMLGSGETAEIDQRLQSISIELTDITSEIKLISDRTHADPARLQQVEERLALIYSLLRRHKADTVEVLISMRDAMEARIKSLDLGDEKLKSVELDAKRAKKLALQYAAELTQTRVKQTQLFAQQLAIQARPLGMENLRVELTVSPTPLSPSGADSVEFLFAFNKNQNPTTIASSASGGEISRLMLAVKAIAAEAMQMPAIVFDEIDTGVSGAIASRMGKLMKQISKKIQVIAITHLPQVAALGNKHFRVYKYDTEKATVSAIQELTENERIHEIAQMLSADAIDQSAIENAKTLILNQ